MKILGLSFGKDRNTAQGNNTHALQSEVNLSNGNVSKKRLSPTVKRETIYRVKLELSTFKTAVEAAQMVDNPNRNDLYNFYNQVIKDSHLASQIRTAVQSVLQSGFFITKKTDPDDKLTELIRTQWFDKFVELCLEAEFWGHSLIEFSLLNEESVFTDCQLIPREHVKPEAGLVVVKPSDTKGIYYRDAADKFGLIEIGETHDLGLLEIAAVEVITKNYARTDWSQASEKYGMPLLKIRTNTQDDKELDRMENMAANFGANGYIILNMDDDADIITTNAGDWFNIYKENIAVCDQNISKIINGQTGTSDEKAFVGSAEVHERILNDYTRARLRNLQHIINNKLIPFLTFYGYPFDGAKFYYSDLIKKDPETEMPDDENEDSKKDESGDNTRQDTIDQKKKLSNQLILPNWVFDMPQEI